MIILAVSCFAAGIALLMMSTDFRAVHRSRLPREYQNRAGAKSLATVVTGGALALAGVVLLVLRAIGAA